MKTKQNAIDLTDLAIGVLILGITVGIGSRILLQYRDNRLTDLSTTTTVNESVPLSDTVTSDTLANTWVSSVDACYNSTGDGLIPPANYTVSISDLDGVATVSNATINPDQGWNCTYTTYDITEAQWALPNDAATGLAEYGNWFDIIVIVGIAGVILALIFMAFGDRGTGQQSASY